MIERLHDTLTDAPRRLTVVRALYPGTTNPVALDLIRILSVAPHQETFRVVPKRSPTQPEGLLPAVVPRCLQDHAVEGLERGLSIES